MDNYIFPFQLIEKNAKIVLYGAGTVGSCFYKQMLATKYAEVVLWLDKNYQQYQEKHYPVKGIEALAEKTDFDYIVIAIDNVLIAEEVKCFLTDTYKIDGSIIVYSDKYRFPGCGQGLFRDEWEEIKEVDRLLLDGKIKKKIDYDSCGLTDEKKYEIRSLYHRSMYKGKKVEEIATKEISVADLFLAQFYEGDYTNYKHCDAAVRMLAIEEYYGKNEIGFELYDRMQRPSGFDWRPRFKRLIQSCEEKGIQGDSMIETDRHFAIMDGSHRATLALYRGKEFLQIKMLDCLRDRGFDMSFFWKNGFSVEECQLIRKKTKDILNGLNYEYIGVIWPPAYKIADRIIEELNQFEPDEIAVTEYQDYKLEEQDFNTFFKAVYHTDILDDEGVRYKTGLIKSCMKDYSVFEIRVFRLKCNNPRIALNPKNNSPQSQTIKKIKEVFRNRLQSEIDNYQYDVLMHITDNYLQSKFVDKCLRLDRDVSGLTEVLNKYKYAIIRLHGRQASNFPYYYYFSDIDVIVEKKSMECMRSDIESYLKEKYSGDWFSLERTEQNESIIVWVKLRDFYAFGVHLQTTKYSGLSSDFTRICLEKRVRLENGLYCLPDELDLVFRMVSYIDKLHKVWHLDFVRQNRQRIDKDIIVRAVGDNEPLMKAIEELIKEIQGE